MKNTNDISHAFRLLPGTDLRNSINDFVKEKNVAGGWIATCVGSLSEYSLRFANESQWVSGVGFFEIVSLTGTISVNGLHLHICIADKTGKTTGGHLVEGCKIYTTAEIVLIESGKYIFTREKDDGTSRGELCINEK